MMISEFLSIAIALLALPYVVRDGAAPLLFGLFLFGALYFSYAVIPLITGENRYQLDALHSSGSGNVAKLTALIFLAISLGRMGKRYYRYVVSDRNVSLLFMLVILTTLIPGILTIMTGDFLQKQNLLAVVAMYGLIWFGYVGLRNDKESGLRVALGVSQLAVLISIQVFALLVACYEVFSLRAWATFLNNSGEIVYRASSIQFNPNVYGMWCAILVLGFSYAFHQKCLARWIALLGIVTASGGLFFSGSRSAGLLLGMALAAVAILIREGEVWRRWVPFFSVFVVFTAISAISIYFIEYPGWNAVALLGERFIAYPLQLFNYFGVAVPHFYVGLPKDVVLSIEGRFSVGVMRDSGILTLYDDAGWPGLVAMVGLWLTMGIWGIKTYLVRLDVPSVYALMAFSFCVFISVVMRFQVFPVWVFVATILTYCVYYWRSANVQEKQFGHRSVSRSSM